MNRELELNEDMGYLTVLMRGKKKRKKILMFSCNLDKKKIIMSYV